MLCGWMPYSKPEKKKPTKTPSTVYIISKEFFKEVVQIGRIGFDEIVCFVPFGTDITIGCL